MKKVLSNIIYVMVLMLCSYLLIANILHFCYLHHHDTYNFDSEVMVDVRDNFHDLEENMNLINALDTKVYSQEDLSTIKEKMNENFEFIKENELLNYKENKKLYATDLFNLYMTRSLSVLSNISTLNVLEKYDSRIADYLELYKKQWIANAYKEGDYLKLLENYKYQTPSLISNDFYTPDHVQILSIIHEYNASISIMNYEAKLILEIGGVPNE